MSNSRRWREFITWWNDIYPKRKCGQYDNVDRLIQAVNDKISQIQRNSEPQHPKESK